MPGLLMPVSLVPHFNDWSCELKDGIDTTIKAFEAIGRAIGDAAPVTADNITVEFDQVVPGQFGLEESELPVQPEETVGNVTLQTEIAVGLPWPEALAVEWANRYVSLCLFVVMGGQRGMVS
jgi:alpha,alpha-trehalase